MPKISDFCYIIKAAKLEIDFRLPQQGAVNQIDPVGGQFDSLSLDRKTCAEHGFASRLELSREVPPYRDEAGSPSEAVFYGDNAAFRKV